jgi:hypothetical protein
MVGEQPIKIVKTGPSIVVESGADVGMSAAYFSLRYPAAAIVAIEPERDLLIHAGAWLDLLLHRAYRLAIPTDHVSSVGTITTARRSAQPNFDPETPDPRKFALVIGYHNVFDAGGCAAMRI